MAVRITHQNNSQGHDGTYVYRSTETMDPQNLPAPIADEAPVALGATFEYVDSPEDGTYYYRTQDHEGEQVSAVSAEVSIQVGFSAQVGDSVEGGIYAGQISYADGRNFHLIAADPAAEIYGTALADSMGTLAGADSTDDGRYNTDKFLALALNHPAINYCVNHDGGGNTDWYMPSEDELALVRSNIGGMYTVNLTVERWSSYEWDADRVRVYPFTSGGYLAGKVETAQATIPVRRIPA